MRTGQRGTRPTLAIWAALITLLGVAGCAREEIFASASRRLPRLRPHLPRRRPLRRFATARTSSGTVLSRRDASPAAWPYAAPRLTARSTRGHGLCDGVRHRRSRHFQVMPATSDRTWKGYRLVDRRRTGQRDRQRPKARRHVLRSADVVRLVQAHVGDNRRSRDRGLYAQPAVPIRKRRSESTFQIPLNGFVPTVMASPTCRRPISSSTAKILRGPSAIAWTARYPSVERQRPGAVGRAA